MSVLNKIVMGSVVVFGVGCGQGNSANSVEKEKALVEKAVEVADEAIEKTAVAKETVEAATVDVSGAVSGLYISEPTHRYINFSYVHQGYSSPVIRWRDWDAELIWNAESPEQSSVSVSIDVASIDTGVDEFDEHMQGENLFATVEFPKITFTSTAIELTGPDTGKITGDLSIKGTTKPVTLDAKFNKGAFDQRSNLHRIGFSAKTTLQRSDFGMGFAVPHVGDEVKIWIEAEFIEQKQE